MKFIKRLLKVCAVVVLFIVLYIGFFADKKPKYDIENSRVFVVIDRNETEITDENDITALKNLFMQKDVFKNSIETSCGFYRGYALKFTDPGTGEDVWICPACDKCPCFQIDGHFYEVPKNIRSAFENIVMKYGMTFPNV